MAHKKLTAMKNIPTQLISAASLAAALAALAFAGCSKSDRADATSSVKSAYTDSKDAVVDAWNDVKSYTFDKRDDFNARATAQMDKMKARTSELRANYSEAQASASRKAALEELKNSEADYKDKIDALGNATADTWDSAKENAVSAWDRLKSSYDKARAD